jgi:hypothetical protein
MFPLLERPITPSALILDEPVSRRIRITRYSAKNSYAHGFGLRRVTFLLEVF